MQDPDFRQQQWDERYAPHVAPINHYVDEIRELGHAWAPYVAPIHGGIDAGALSILRDPGPATQDGSGSGFLCVENDDASAELQAQLLEAVGLSAADLTPWNAYPWYINKAPNAEQLDAGVATILHIINLMQKLRVVLLQGNDARAAWKRIRVGQPRVVEDAGLTVVTTYHPSRQALFHPDPLERVRRAEARASAFRQVAQVLAARSPT